MPSANRFLRRLVAVGALLSTTVMTAPAAAATLVADGKLDAGYQLGYSFSFLDDKGNVIGDGRLYFGVNSDDNTKFLYFLLPTSYVDNTYGANAAVDWGDKGHTFDDLLGSDGWGVEGKKGGGGAFSWNGNAVEVDYIAGVCGVFKKDGKCDDKAALLDYRSGGVGTELTDGADEKNDGKIYEGGAGDILEIATSLEYNLNQYGGYLTDSPEMTSNTAGNISYVSAVAPDWIYAVGYEIQFAADTFGDDWLNPDVAFSLITVGAVHASPSKRALESYGDPTCILGCSTTTTVPEPSSWALMVGGFALGGWALRRRRRPAPA